MPPKRKKANQKATAVPGLEAAALDPSRPLHAALQERGLQQLQLQLNVEGTSRRGAFELHLAKQPTTEASEQQSLWSGLKRTPRAQKFPPVDDVFRWIVEILGPVADEPKPRQTEEAPAPKQTQKRKRSAKPELAANVSNGEQNTSPSQAKRRK
ncbi:blast:Selenoprotein BthD [Drosophila guanche]|uniref:Blast:Selenoprotein BthD n=1 Tax=Drosophila guanche TaxID=7266 RepID=A0A3B0KMZ9_DROGU|nr:blast:Selenoprotein BthD [Drosophila guanche]